MSPHRQAEELARRIHAGDTPEDLSEYRCPYDPERDYPFPERVEAKLPMHSGSAVEIHEVANHALSGEGFEIRVKEPFNEPQPEWDFLEGVSSFEVTLFLNRLKLRLDTALTINRAEAEVLASGDPVVMDALNIQRANSLEFTEDEIEFLTSYGFKSFEYRTPSSDGGALPSTIAHIFIPALMRGAAFYNQNLSAGQLRSYALDNLDLVSVLASRNSLHHGLATKRHDEMYEACEETELAVMKERKYPVGKILAFAYMSTPKPDVLGGPTLKCPGEYEIVPGIPNANRRLTIAMINLAYDRGIFDLSQYDLTDIG